MVRIEALALTAAALLLPACGGGTATSAKLAGAGRKHFLQTCAICHGADAKGKPKLGRDLHDNEFTKSLSDEELVEFLKVGRSAQDPLNQRGIEMPPRGGNPGLTDQDLAEIAAYLRTL